MFSVALQSFSYTVSLSQHFIRTRTSSTLWTWEWFIYSEKKGCASSSLKGCIVFQVNPSVNPSHKSFKGLSLHFYVFKTNRLFFYFFTLLHQTGRRRSQLQQRSIQKRVYHTLISHIILLFETKRYVIQPPQFSRQKRNSKGFVLFFFF